MFSKGKLLGVKLQSALGETEAGTVLCRTVLCLLVAVSAGCLDSKSEQEELPLDPVAHERKLRDAQKKSKEFVSTTNAIPQRQAPTVVTSENSASQDLLESSEVASPNASNLSNSFKLIAKSDADPSAQAAHAAADAMGVPDVPSSQIAEPKANTDPATDASVESQ